MLLSRINVHGPSFSLLPKQPHMISRPMMYARVIAAMNTSSKALAMMPLQRRPVPMMRNSPSANSNHGRKRARSSTAHRN